MNGDTQKTSKKLHVTLLVPTLNEIVGMREIMPKISRDWVESIVILDGGSTDGTVEYAREQGYDVIIQEKRGLINGYRQAFAQLKTDAVITFSPDGNSIAEAVKDVRQKLDEGYEMVIASRYLGEAKSDDDNIVSGFGNWLFTKVISFCFRFSYTDVMVIFRGYTMDVYRRLGLADGSNNFADDWAIQQSGLGFEPLLSMRAAKAKLRITEVPADEPDRLGGEKKVRHFMYGFYFMLQIFHEIIFWNLKTKK